MSAPLYPQLIEKVELISKESHEISADKSQQGETVTLLHASIVKIHIDRSEIQSIERQSNDLIIVVVDGSSVRIDDFFATDIENGNDLVLVDSEGRIWHAQMGADANYFEGYVEIDTIEQLLADDGFDLAYLALGAAGGGLAAAALGGGSSSGSDETAPPPIVPAVEPTITTVVDSEGAVTGFVARGGVTDDSTLTVSGTGEPGTTVYRSINRQSHRCLRGGIGQPGPVSTRHRDSQGRSRRDNRRYYQW